jgi:hypothetical protein
MQVWALQNPPSAQALSSLQVVWQAPDVHAYPWQLAGTPGMQAPAPLHIEPAITDAFMPSQVGVELQIVPAGAKAQAPLPLQEPTLPHELGDSAGQSSRGSVIAAASVHVPVSLAQLRQAPAQAVLQQVWSTQWLLLQSASCAQAWPLSLGGTVQHPEPPWPPV